MVSYGGLLVESLCVRLFAILLAIDVCFWGYILALCMKNDSRFYRSRDVSKSLAFVMLKYSSRTFLFDRETPGKLISSESFFRFLFYFGCYSSILWSYNYSYLGSRCFLGDFNDFLSVRCFLQEVQTDAATESAVATVVLVDFLHYWYYEVMVE